MKLILFGAGITGDEALSCFGGNNVHCFCDNSITDGNTGEKAGLKIISFQGLIRIHGQYTVIICAGNNYIQEICSQLDDAGVADYFDFNVLKSSGLLRHGAAWFMERLSDRAERNRLLAECYKFQLERTRRQLAYLKKHTEVTALKPARGRLREYQMLLVDLAAEFFEFTEEIHIRPFLNFGSLIGAVRHQGFVPWDDDLDFGILRDDYDRLMQFVSKACIMTCHDGACSDTAGAENQVRQALEADPDRYLVDVCADMTKIYKQTAGGACKIMDLWVYDFYKDDYPIADHMSYLARMAEKRALIKNRKAQVAFLQKEIQNNAAVSREQTTNLFPGLDNWGGYPGLKHADRWIPTEAILPFKKVKFENRLFLAPARADVLLGYEYPDYLEMTYDIGLQSHADDT